MNNLVFVDCEARGPSPVSGILTEFGAVHYVSRATFHGRLFEGRPDPDNPAIPIPGERVATEHEVAARFAAWLREVCGKDRPTFVSDNVAYDWQWIAGLFDRAELENPFGHSGRRISDYYAGLTGRWSQHPGVEAAAGHRPRPQPGQRRDGQRRGFRPHPGR